MHLQHKVRYGLAALATTIGSVFSWNTYQFLTNEPVYPLLSYSGFDMGSPAASLANPTCNSNIAYIACGSDIYLLAGLLAIALIIYKIRNLSILFYLKVMQNGHG